MDYKGALYGLLQKQTKKTDDELASLLENEDGEGLKENALEALLQIDADRVSGLKLSKEDKDKLFDDGFKKGQSQSLGNLEKSIKETFEFQSEKTGLDLVKSLLEAHKSNGNGNAEPQEVTPELIRKSKPFIDEQEKWKAQLSKANEEWEAKISQQKTAFDTEKVFGKVKDRASSVIDNLNPIFSADPVKARKQRSVIIDKLKGYQFDIQEDRTVVLTTDGTVLNDAHEQRVEFEDLVREITTSYYDLPMAQPRGSAGGNGQPTPVDVGSTKKYDFVVPKTSEEYMSAMKGQTPEKRMEITKAWQEQKQSQNS